MVGVRPRQQPPQGFLRHLGLSRSYDFEGERLGRAMAATFERRKTLLPTDLPEALTSAFAQDPIKRQQWQALLRDVGLIGTLVRGATPLDLLNWMTSKRFQFRR